MFDIIELNGKKVADLRQIASKLGITKLDKMKKQDLVYSILDEQAAQPSKGKPAAKSKDDKPKAAPAGRKPADSPKAADTKKDADKQPSKAKSASKGTDKKSNSYEDKGPDTAATKDGTRESEDGQSRR